MIKEENIATVEDFYKGLLIEVLSDYSVEFDKGDIIIGGEENGILSILNKKLDRGLFVELLKVVCENFNQPSIFSGLSLISKKELEDLGFRVTDVSVKKDNFFLTIVHGKLWFEHKIDNTPYESTLVEVKSIEQLKELYKDKTGKEL